MLLSQAAGLLFHTAAELMPNHRLIVDEETRQSVLNWISDLRLDGKRWEVTIRRHRKKRSLNQNALLHKWLAEIAADTGNTQLDVKEAYRAMFLPQVAVQLGDEEHMVGRSTTQLSTQEMSDFLDQIHAHAGQELGIFLPLPDEYGRDEAGRAV